MSSEETEKKSCKSPMFGRLTGKGKEKDAKSATPRIESSPAMASGGGNKALDAEERKHSLESQQPSPKHHKSKLFGGFGLGKNKNPPLKSPTSPPPVGKLK